MKYLLASKKIILSIWEYHYNLDFWSRLSRNISTETGIQYFGKLTNEDSKNSIRL